MQGNFIGTDVTGSAALGNGGTGIVIHDNASNNTVGGKKASERNIISGNGFRGAWLMSSNNTVSGNYIGTNVTGRVALGNSDVGLVIEGGAQFNKIGGTKSGERNIISASGHFGVWILGSNNTISGNYIGTNAPGTRALGNGWSGIEIHSNAVNNIIGGTSSGAGNLIYGNEEMWDYFRESPFRSSISRTVFPRVSCV